MLSGMLSGMVSGMVQKWSKNKTTDENGRGFVMSF